MTSGDDDDDDGTTYYKACNTKARNLLSTQSREIVLSGMYKVSICLENLKDFMKEQY